jgi:pimeloyl-ACP methyl ester carboxylesterase
MMERLSRMLFRSGVGLAGLGLAVHTLNATAVPVVVDVSLGALVVAVVAILLLIAAYLTRRDQRLGRAGQIWMWLGLLSVLFVMGISGWLLFFSFEAEEIQFSSGEAELSGTLYLPPSPGPHPAVVFVHGSGPETRRELSYYARVMARAGIAGLAYDKRGTGVSTGDLYATDYAGYAADAAAAMARLREHPRIQPDRVGLVGFSEGEWVGLLAARRDPRAAFLVVVAASGTSPARQVNMEIGSRLRAKGYSEEIIEQALALNRRIFAYQRTGREDPQLDADLAQARQQAWFAAAGQIPDRLYPAADYGWWRSVMDFDPAPVWEQIDIPVLILKGGRDPKSPVDVTRRAILSALARGGNTDVEFVALPAADHALLEWPLGEGIPPPVFTDGYLDKLVDWVKAKTRATVQD